MEVIFTSLCLCQVSLVKIKAVRSEIFLCVYFRYTTVKDGVSKINRRKKERKKKGGREERS